MATQTDQNKSQNRNNPPVKDKSLNRSTFKNQPPVKDPKDPREPEEYEMSEDDKKENKADNPYHELQLEDQMGVDSDVDVPPRRSTPKN